jgi:hypothetical protein
MPNLSFEVQLNMLLPGLFDIGSSVSMHTPLGQMHTEDIALVKHGALYMLGWIKLLASGRLPGSSDLYYFFLLDRLQKHPSGLWISSGQEQLYLPVGEYLCTVTYLDCSHAGVFPLIPFRYKGSVAKA